MAPTSWKRRFARFASAAAVVGLACAAGIAIRGDIAEACSGWEPTIADLTTFDPGVLGEDSWGGLDYDPFTEGYGGPCHECATKAMAADWHGFLKDAVTPADWDQVLMKASLSDISAIQLRLKGKSPAAPKGFESSSMWTASNPGRVYAAVEYVELLRRMEPQVTFEPFDGKPRPAPGTTLATELAAAQRGMKAAKEPFMQQRYAFAALRALFFRQEWAQAIAFHDKNLATLAAPSEDLKWRARWYVAGALRKADKPARANLELARLHSYYPLAGMAVFDFNPSEDDDWKDALQLAKDPKDKVALWRMVGVKHDAMVAAQEIVKLDPKSPLVALLVVRELERAESQVERMFSRPPDPKEVAAQKKAYARIEAFANKLAAAPGTSKPYLYDLIAGHIAAKRGDLAAARARLQKAVAAAPTDKRLASQAKASLSIALVANYKLDPRNEDEVASLMRGIGGDFSRMGSVKNEVRTKLALAYATANNMVDAEFLAHSVADTFDDGSAELQGKLGSKWQSVPFLKEMIARTDKRTTEFDRFVLEASHVKEDLQQDLAVRLTLDGDFKAAKAVYDTSNARSELLNTDPFVIHVIDCHDCDHEKLGPTSMWTHKNLVERLAELELIAKGGGEQGAQAALAIGNALYNITHHGNARTFTGSSHQSTSDARLAERYYKQVYNSSGNRELKAKAAWLAAKSELGTLIHKEQELLTPTTWFPIFAKFQNTKYYKEVLAECGRFRDWVKTR
ncbi:MAG: hypothetical protein H0T46_34685 [Deltaproteobacteria bacterium]|nr:hypothetical protein [Deltaproteobacteria bacterium]